MRNRFQHSVANILFCGAIALGVAPAAAIDDARLQAASNSTTDWLTYGHTYENQRFSTLDQINTDTVSALAPRWIYQTGISATFLATPMG